MDELEGQPDQLISFDVVVDGDHHATVSIDGELDMSGIDPLAARVDEVLGNGVTTTDCGRRRRALRRQLRDRAVGAVGQRGGRIRTTRAATAAPAGDRCDGPGREVGGDNMRRMRTFPAIPQSVHAARRFATDTLSTSPASTVEAVELMVSELATNCIRHERTSFHITILGSTQEIRIEVTDSGSGTPTMRSPGPDEPSGRGSADRRHALRQLGRGAREPVGQDRVVHDARGDGHGGSAGVRGDRHAQADRRGRAGVRRGSINRPRGGKNAQRAHVPAPARYAAIPGALRAPRRRCARSRTPEQPTILPAR